MSITAERRQEVIRTHRTHEMDCGSPQVQIAILTERIRVITEHLKRSPKDHDGRRGLLKMVGCRNTLLRYLAGRDRAAYRTLIGALGLRK